ncbi:hypothetical protein GDO81_022688 [Engystomops pustulosus]|uniref:Peptidase S1 domain-containing protein n=1 Tax=Engystomops pustulosus TaxID=76066 RepID=A0AAV6YWS9_ENGPU|nr:hypothetical protein GDO81_022688 [Engystomops pustulosus]
MSGKRESGPYLLSPSCLPSHHRPLNVSLYTVYLGAHQLSNLLDPQIVSRKVQQIIIHPDFVSEGSSGDIALLELEKPVSFTSYILPVCLPSQAVKMPGGTMCWTTGWGDVAQGVPLGAPQTLQEVEVALIDNTNCEAMYGSAPAFKSSLIQEDMICAGYQEGKKDSCQGDSGGPLVCKVNGVWLQLGVTSWGDGCAVGNRPGIYTRVQYYQSWLLQYVPSLPYSSGGTTGSSTTEAPNTLKPLTGGATSRVAGGHSTSRVTMTNGTTDGGASSQVWSMGLLMVALLCSWLLL